MGEHELETIAEKVIFTPAERAVLAEQGEASRLALEQFIDRCKHGTSGDVFRAYIPAARSHDYVTHIFNVKVSQAMYGEDE